MSAPLTRPEDPPPPQNIPAEQAVLGIVLSHPKAMRSAAEILTAEDFCERRHQFLWTVCRGMDERGEPVDRATVATELERMGKLDGVGGTRYLTWLVDYVPSGTTVEFHAEEVHAQAVLRDTDADSIELHQRIKSVATGADLAEVAENIHAIADRIANRIAGTGHRGPSLAVRQEVNRLRIRDEAQRLFRAAQADLRPPAALVLSDFLAVPDEPLDYRIDRLWPTGGRVMCSAQFKAGKTTLVGNLIRALVDGDDFLGNFAVTPTVGRVVLVDTELDQRMLRRWLREQGIRNTDQVAVVPLRGKVSTFNLLDRDVRRQWATTVRDLDGAVLLFDCLRPVLDALGLDENRDAGRFLVAFDELLQQAGTEEAVVVHHMGHAGERARGDSRLRDWPDAEWRLVRDNRDEYVDDPAAPRYFSAYGRDVDVPESALEYQNEGRKLTLAGGSRNDTAAKAVVPRIIELLTGESVGLSGRQIEEALTEAGEKQKAIRKALKIAVEDGAVIVEPGPKRAKLHRLNPSASVRHSASPVRQRSESECVSASIEDAHTLTADTTSNLGVRRDALKPTSDTDGCDQCHHPLGARPVRYPGGKTFCRRCAYPTEPEQWEEAS